MPGHELNYIQEKTGGEIDFLKHYKTSYTCSYGQCPSDPFPDRNSYCSSGFVSNRRPFLQYNDKICEKYNSALRVKICIQHPTQLIIIRFDEDCIVKYSLLSNELLTTSMGETDLSGVSVGRKEESGSTHNANNFAALTNRFFDSYKPDQPDWKTDKSTGLTVYKNDFRPYSYKTVPEFFSRWIGNSSYQLPSSYVIQNKLCPEYVNYYSSNVYGYGQYLPEGYLEDLRKSDLAEYQNVIHGTIEPSMSKGSYNGLEHQSKTAGELLNGVTIGSLEPSGSTLNISGNVLSQDTPPDRFVTHNMTRYYSPPPGRDDGGCGGNIYFDVQPSKETESSRSIRIRYFDN
ncbi:protein phosphatase 1 regulatory subunit 32 [Schistosoma japonicum]|nr:protein phosphatase 1 regulatory subunit 32 [Schistosoma japonicum]